MKTPPRLVARTLMVTFVTVAVILTVVFVVITLDVRDRVRAARGASEAFAELQRYVDTQFDAACVDALLAAMPSSHDMPEPALAQLLGRQLV